MTTIAPQPVEDVKQEILQHVLKKLSPFRRRKAEGLASGKPGAPTQLKAQTDLVADKRYPLV
jgi:hypothetical protein